MPSPVTCVVSHWVGSPVSHMKQCPQAIWKGTTTRSPGRRSGTSEPTSSTMPMGSWPRMSPGVMNGVSTSYRCRSEPHSPVDVMRTTASVGSSIRGSGTSSTRTSRLPCQVTAFMGSHSLGRVRLRPVGGGPPGTRAHPCPAHSQRRPTGAQSDNTDGVATVGMGYGARTRRAGADGGAAGRRLTASSRRAAPATAGTVRTAGRRGPPATPAPSRSAVAGSPLAVKIDNVRAARPHYHGLGAADVVYVEQVEGGLSRLLAVYATRLPRTVGPVRSVPRVRPGAAAPVPPADPRLLGRAARAAAAGRPGAAARAVTRRGPRRLPPGHRPGRPAQPLSAPGRAAPRRAGPGGDTTGFELARRLPAARPCPRGPCATRPPASPSPSPPGAAAG